DETNALLKLVTSNLAPSSRESTVVKNDKVIAQGIFRINPFKSFREEHHVPNKPPRASVRKKPITVTQPSVINNKTVNSNSNGSPSTGVDNITKTRRPQPRSNTKNDRVSSASKSSGLKNKEVEVEEHHRTLLLSKNKKHMSYVCNNIKLSIQNAKSEVFLGTIRFGNDHIAAILDQSIFVERLGHNLFSVGQFCDSYLEVAFRRNTCYVRNLEGVDLLKGNRTTNLYAINLHNMASASPICLIARATSTKSKDEAPEDVDELEQQQHVQKQDNQAPLQPKIVADNVLNAMLDANIFVNPFAPPSTSAAELSSSQYVDPLNMHTFYQPYPHEYLWNKDHHQEQVIGEPSRPVLIRNQLRTDCDMCIYALTVSTMELRNIKGAMTSPAWIDSMQEELLLFKRLDV
ncbi:hypothetical protein Tco_1023724, partial [Tanacetum coccineum]